ncbi:hypothetical protein [Niallia sp. MER 6]|uniref:hypothetical protein n=1 Tax=Niallia sp. MER 6 TaxID=2939567 RepID=UPI00204244BD|nr:hypothetical protein [Niallia sp. MER 6]
MNNRVKEFWLGMNFVKKVKKKGFRIEMLSKFGASADWLAELDVTFLAVTYYNVYNPSQKKKIYSFPFMMNRI